MTKYTDSMIKELKALPTPLNYASATAFAEKYGISPRSVTAKARALDIPYQAKVPGQAKEDKSPLKADLVKVIEKALGVTAPSLSKCTVPDLNKIVEALG